MIDQLLSSNVYQALVNASSPSAINPYITASVITSGYVPYIGATSNLNLGTFSLTAGLGQFGAGTNSGRQVEIFQDSANVKIGSLVGTPTSSALYLNQATPSATNYVLMDDGSSVYLNGRTSNSIYISLAATNIVRFGSNFQIHTPISVTSGSTATFAWTKPNNTGQTASTNIPGFLFTTGSRQWATGDITAQEEIRITSPTYSFVGASTITNAYTLFVNAPTAGTNATITNNYGLGVSGNTAVGGKLFVTSTLGSIPEGYDLEVNKSVSGGVESLTRNKSNGSASFARNVVRGDGSQQLHMAVFSSGYTPVGLILQNSAGLYTGGTDVSNLLIGHFSASKEIHFLSGSITSAIHTMRRGGQTSGAYSNFEWSPISNTGQTASTEINGYLYNSYSRQWAAGAINNQRERYYKTVTYSFASASTITNAYGAYFEAPTAGNNATINNNWSLGTNGNLLCQGSLVSSSPSGGVGYFIGAGSTVTQITSRTTGVTINNVCGAITLVSAAGTTTWQSFTVTNSRVTATDVIIVNQGTGTDLYQIFVTNVAAGSFRITFATTGGTTTEQPVFGFAVIKAVTA